MSARPCPGSIGGPGASEDRYTAAVPMEKTSISPACWRGGPGLLAPGVSSLLEMLAGIGDPRDPRGVRHRLVAVLGAAIVATLAGAANYRELGSVAADCRRSCCACWDRARRRFVPPSAATLRRVLIGPGCR